MNTEYHFYVTYNEIPPQSRGPLSGKEREGISVEFQSQAK